MPQCKACGSNVAESATFCPTCGSPVQLDTKESGKPVTGEKLKAGSVGKILFPVLLLAGVGMFIWYVNPSVHPVIKKQPVVAEPADYGPEFVEAKQVFFREEGDDFIFSLDDLKRHRLVRFEYVSPTLKRAVIAYLGTDGRLVTAIGVSEHCGSTEFKIKDNKIYCAKCPSNWDMMTMEAYACCQKYFPDPIPSRVEGDEVHIKRDVVVKWAGRF